MIHIAHKIQLLPNQQAVRYFKQAFGCARLAYNWGLSKWQEHYKEGNKKSWMELRKEFNSIKWTNFPFLKEVTKYSNRELFVADRFYPSSKICSNCGNINNELTLKDRTYLCSKCGLEIDRDFNASLNLIQVVGVIQPEFTPVDLMAMLNLNNLATFEVETGISRR